MRPVFVPRPALLLLAAALAAPVARAQEGLYGGIDVGSKGVKATVVQVTPGPNGPDTKIRYAKTANTTVAAGVLKTGRYSEAAIQETVEEIDKFYKELVNGQKVPADRISIVGSSGHPKAENRADLVAAVKARTGQSMSFIDVSQEAELTFLGVVPPEAKATSVLVDVGSGNTKGGFYEKAGGNGQEQFVTVSVPLGTVTYTEKVKKEAADKKTPFPDTARQLADADLVKPLSDAVKGRPALAGVKNVYLSGGVVWALVTLLKPEEVANTLVPVTAEDIDNFQALLAKTPGVFPAVDVAKVPESARQAASADLQRVKDTFTPDNLVAGGEILKALATSLDLKNKKALFARNGFVAWIAGYSVPEMRARLAKQAEKQPEKVPAPKVEKPADTPKVEKPAEKKTDTAPAADKAPEKLPAPVTIVTPAPVVAYPATAPYVSSPYHPTSVHGNGTVIYLQPRYGYGGRWLNRR